MILKIKNINYIKIYSYKSTNFTIPITHFLIMNEMLVYNPKEGEKLKYEYINIIRSLLPCLEAIAIRKILESK